MKIQETNPRSESDGMEEAITQSMAGENTVREDGNAPLAPRTCSTSLYMDGDDGLDSFDGDHDEEPIECYHCRGRGYVLGEECEWCDGTGED